MRTMLTIASLAFVATTSLAFAQAAPPKPTAAAIAQTGTVVAPAPTTGLNPEVAMATWSRNVELKQANCQTKGPLYTFMAPHKPGDLLPSGKMATTFTNGQCKFDVAKAKAQLGIASGAVVAGTIPTPAAPKK